MRRAVPALVMGLAAVVAAVCAGCTPKGETLGDPQAMMIRFEQGGGQVPWPLPLAYLVDGRLYTPAPEADPVPPLEFVPVLARVQSRPVAAETIRRWVKTLRDAGVENGSDWNIPDLMDASSVGVVLDDGTGPVTTSIYGLGDEEFAGDAVPRGQRAGRREITSVLDEMMAASPEAKPLEPTTVLLRSTVLMAEDAALRTSAPWPGPPLGIGPTRSNGVQHFSCTEVDAAGVAMLLPRLRRAPGPTAWVDAGVSYRVHVRPRLPKESGCLRADPTPVATVSPNSRAPSS